MEPPEEEHESLIREAISDKPNQSGWARDIPRPPSTAPQRKVLGAAQSSVAACFAFSSRQLFLLTMLVGVVLLFLLLVDSKMAFAIEKGVEAGMNATETPRDAHPPVLYGHVHMAKTGGTSLNGLLANKFERVCGIKGYSYDAYADNVRAKKKKEAGKPVQLREDEWGRGRVRPSEMEMTGYEDCDYVSHEIGWSFWPQTFWPEFHGLEMELHVPCRSPIDHLMSQCNYQHIPLECNASDGAFFRAINRCMVFPDRFSKGLLDHFTVKCFDFQKQFTTYIDHMAGILQHRRFESMPYVKRETNRPRNKTRECIWNDEKARAKAERYLISRYDYYKFCDECMGAADEIARNSTRRI